MAPDFCQVMLYGSFTLRTIPVALGVSTCRTPFTVKLKSLVSMAKGWSESYNLILATLLRGMVSEIVQFQVPLPPEPAGARATKSCHGPVVPFVEYSMVTLFIGPTNDQLMG